MNTRLRTLARVMVATTVLTSLLVAAPALATELGENVDYDLVFPVDGGHHFSDTFWAGRSHGFHVGQDIMADKMTPVVAVADGVVRLVNWTSREHMNPDRCCTLVIRHDDGWESWYIHLDNDTTGTDDGKGWGIKRAITPGVRVAAGEHIAWVGDSGNAENTAPHVHFELRDPNGVVVNSYGSLVAAGGNDVGTGQRDPLIGGARVLRMGLDGADVHALQDRLAGLGYATGTPDGQFGLKTDAAVRAFQKTVGMTVDGLVGSQTKTALVGLSYSDGTDETLRIGSRGNAVRDLQRTLNDQGFDSGSPDGIFGPLTLRAVLSFQQHHKLWVDGLVGPRTKKSLGIQF